MSRRWAMSLFLVMALLLWAAIHVYLALSLVYPHFSGLAARGWTLLLGVSFVVTTCGVSLRPWSGRPWADWGQLMGYLGMGIIGVLTTGLIVRDLGFWLVDTIRSLSGAEAVDSGRRAVLLGLVDGAVLGTTAWITTRGFLNTRQAAVIERVEVPVADLPVGLDGLRIAQVSDIHVGPTIRRDRVQQIVDAVNQLGADLVAVTGDLVDDSVRALREHVSPIAALRAPLGVFFCTGNHEYYVGAESWCRHLQELGLEVLVNEHRVLSHGGETLVVGGVSDLRAERILSTHRSDPAQAFAGAPEQGFRLLLAHQPKSVHEAARAGADLQVSGHTHGGQFWPFTWLAHLVQPFVVGLHRVRSTWLYVNRGATWWGPPLRLGSPQEITLLTLRRTTRNQESG